MKKAMALLLACSMVLAFAACSKKQYKDTEVTAVVDVTDDNGKTVTDKDGKAQTRVVTVPQTDAKGNTVAPAGDSGTSANGKTTAKPGSGKTTAKSGKDKTEKTEKADTTAKKAGTTKQGETTKKDKTTEKTTETTTVAANRKIHITVSLPAGANSHTDKLRIYIDGKQVDEKEVTLEIGTIFTYTTEKKYRGDVKVQVELVNTKKSQTKTVKKGKDTVHFEKLEGVENLNGDDD